MAECRSRGGELLVIETPEEQKWLQRYLNILYGDKWVLLNAHRYAFNPKGAAWADGRLLSEENTKKTDFDEAPCNGNDAALNDCYQMTAKGEMMATKCTKQVDSFLCKKLVRKGERGADCRKTQHSDLLCSPNDAPKEEKYWTNGACGPAGDQNCKYLLKKRIMSWSRARHICREMGAELVWLESAKEAEEVNEKVCERESLQVSDFTQYQYCILKYTRNVQYKSEYTSVHQCTVRV